MKEFTVKRVLTVLLGMFLPVVVIMGILQYSTRHSYLAAADSFGVEFGQSMAQQAGNTVQLVSKENWNTLSVAAAAMPEDFAGYDSNRKVLWLKELAASNQGRGCTFIYYSQTGRSLSSDGVVSAMHYTGRPDLSAVLTGASEQSMYGPVYDGDTDSDDTATNADPNAEHSGYVVYYNLPVRDSKGIIQGVLSLRRDAYEYCDGISDSNLGENGYTCVVNEEGEVIAVSRADRLQLVNSQTNLLSVSDARAEAAAAALAGESGVLTQSDGETGAATLIYRPLYEEGEENGEAWAVLVCLPQSDVRGYMLSEAGNDVSGTLGSGLAILLLIALFAFYLAFDVIRARKNRVENQAEEYRDVLDQTLRALAGTIDARNIPGRGHNYRVAAYARALGEHLELTDAQMQELYFQAALHDVGMVAVPETVLEHESVHNLTPDEVKQLRAHVTVGGRILGKLTDLPGINVGAMYHHQNYDGSGYCSDDAAPAKGEDIPLTARIITVADAYDEMRMQGRDDADQALERGKSKRFDPVLAEIMIQLIHDGTMARVTAQVEETLRTHAAELAEL